MQGQAQCHGRLCLKCDGTRAETRFRLSAKRTNPFKLTGASVQSTTGRRAVHISLQGLYCSCKPVFCSHVTLTGYPLHSLVSPSLILACVTVCHHVSTGLYNVHADRHGTLDWNIVTSQPICLRTNWRNIKKFCSLAQNVFIYVSKTNKMHTFC